LQVPKNPTIRVISHWLSEAEIAELLQTHHVLVLPYTSATQSGVITLGISAGIPMLITKVGGLPEQLTDNEAIWINPDPVEIAQGIRLLSTQPGQYASLHEKMRRKKENFSWQQPAAQLAGLIIKRLTKQGF
jgi:glycosyltransferase involved in cell wall biosynthesis